MYVDLLIKQTLTKITPIFCKKKKKKSQVRESRPLYLVT